jgi:hypothetical protein
LLPADFSKRHACAAEFRRHGQQKILCCPQVLEIFFKESVFPVVAGGSLSKTSEHVFRKYRFSRPRQVRTRISLRNNMVIAG